MQSDNDVRSGGSRDDQAVWSSAFTNELLRMIKSRYRTQVAFVDHVNQPPPADSATKHEKYPRLSKQQLSKRLKKATPDWPLANMIIKCCTHDDAAATSSELARMAGIYEAATGGPPKGYTGPRVIPAVPPTGTGEPGQREVQSLRVRMADAQRQLAECRKELGAREREVDQLSRQARMSSAANVSTRSKLTRMGAEIEQLRVQLSDTTALYQDQAARAKAYESRLHTLWERYALLNASRETTTGQPVFALGATAMHPPGLVRRVNSAAPAPRRVLAVYLQSYRELSEQSLGTIAAAAGIDEERVSAILSAEVPPSLPAALAIAAAVTAPAATVQRLHATMVDDPSSFERPVNTVVPGAFEEIIAAMADSATVAGLGDSPCPVAPPGTVTATSGRPVAAAAVPAPSARAGSPATVAGDGRRQSSPEATSSTASPGNRRSKLRETIAVATAATVAIWCLTVLVLLQAPIAVQHALSPYLERSSTLRVIASAGLLTLLLVTVLAGAGLSLRLTARRIARQFYRGRHIRPGDNDERRTVRAFRPAGVETGPALPYRFPVTAESGSQRLDFNAAPPIPRPRQPLDRNSAVK